MARPRAQLLTGYKGLYADAGLAALVLLIIGMMIVPLPTWLLDVLIASNLALSILLLIAALYVPHALSFSSLPSLLLVSTLYRLALNVSSTRLILLQADAGRVIRAFGDFVVRGDYVVGATVFAIISLVQYIVVAKGGERVAEVAARFTLDAMPGKQLAIDADLRSGALRVDAARKRRAALERESQFYGAMDGALKFIKGDAIASLVIVAVALFAGTGIGVGSRGMPLREALQLYGILAIGDGLVSQLPSLVTSIAAGLVVTRVAAPEQETSLAQDLVAQLFAAPRSLIAASACMLVLALVPGLPALPLLVPALLTGALAYARSREQRAQPSTTAADAQSALLELELGPQLAAAVQTDPAHDLDGLLERTRTDAAARLGVTAPRIRVSAPEHSPANGYLVRLCQAPVLQGEAKSPVELCALLNADLGPMLARRARELLSHDDVQRRLDALAEHAPTLVRSAQTALPLTQLTELLRRLLDEGVSIAAFERILECLAASGEPEPKLERALDRARRALRDQLALQHARGGVLHLHRIDPMIEDVVRDATQRVSQHQNAALPPELAQDLANAVRAARSQHAVAPVLVTQPDVRRALRDALCDELPEVAVLSYAELPANLPIEEREPISVKAGQ